MTTTTVKNLIKCQQFDQKMRREATVSDYTDIQVYPLEGHVRLALQNNGPPGEGYSTDADISIILPAHHVGKVSSWDMIQIIGATPKDLDLNQVTSIEGRLWDGATHYYWDGGAWAAAGASDWNTIEDINTNLSTWDPDVDLGVVLNLITTDREFTPTVSGVLLLCTISLPDFMEDWVYGTVVAQLQDDIRPMTDMHIISEGDIDPNLSMGDGYEGWADSVDSIDGVWNLTTDPNERTDIFDSYDPVTRDITLTGAPTTGDTLLVRAKYAPVVAVQTDMDYEVDASTPSLVFNAIDTLDFGVGGVDSHIMNVYASPPSGVILPSPRRAHVNFSLEARAPLGIDLMRLVGEVVNWMDTNMAPQSEATGERASLMVTSTFTRTSRPNNDGMHSANMTFRLLDINNWNRPAITAGAPGSDGQGYGVGTATVRTQVGSSSNTTEITE